jgi:hypothetical protein
VQLNYITSGRKRKNKGKQKSAAQTNAKHKALGRIAYLP